MTTERGLFERIDDDAEYDGNTMIVSRSTVKMICAEFEQRLAEAEQRIEQLTGRPFSCRVYAAMESRLFQEKEKIKQLNDEMAAKQAKIDALMLEYCPDEMMLEQISEWERHQELVDAQSQDNSLLIKNLCNKIAQLENVVAKANAVDAHWNEFGPEHEFDESMHWLSKSLEQYRSDIEMLNDPQPSDLQPALIIGEDVIEQRDDYINYLKLIADKIGLETEPHQSYFDRLLERIEQLVKEQPARAAEPVAYMRHRLMNGDGGLGSGVVCEFSEHPFIDGAGGDVEPLYDQPCAAVPEHDEYHQLAFEISTPDEDGDWYRFTPTELDDYVMKLFSIAPSWQEG